jgi:hypothetical protein
MVDQSDPLQNLGAESLGKTLARKQDRLSTLVSAQVNCLFAAKNCDPSLRPFWLSAAESYAVLKQSVRAFNPGRASAHTDRQSGDSNCMMPLPGQDDQ